MARIPANETQAERMKRLDREAMNSYRASHAPTSYRTSLNRFKSDAYADEQLLKSKKAAEAQPA